MGEPMIFGKKDPSGEGEEDDDKGYVFKIEIVLISNLRVYRDHHDNGYDDTDNPTYNRKTPLAIHLTLNFSLW